MAKIRAKASGDVFEAPAADFSNEADFEIVDDSTPVTTEPPGAASASGEPVTGASAPAAPVSSGSTAAPAATLSSDPASTQTSAALTPATAPESPPSTTAASADAAGPSATNLASLTGPGANAAPAASLSTDAPAVAQPGEFSTNVDSGSSPSVLPVNPGSAPLSADATLTGGPLAGNGATPEARAKHAAVDQHESFVRSEIQKLVTWTDHLEHAAAAFFAQIRSHIDNEAAS